MTQERSAFDICNCGHVRSQHYEEACDTCPTEVCPGFSLFLADRREVEVDG